MIAGAQVDARTYLLPNAVTWGGIASGILAAPALDSLSPWWSSAGTAIVRATATAVALLLLRWCYTWLRAREGLGLGDVKLAAAVGSWLPAASIPLCFALATCSALVVVALARIRGERVDLQRSCRLAHFSAQLCVARLFLRANFKVDNHLHCLNLRPNTARHF
jgi:leader peptidase (prepilin peptidase) / N-methyltransferase